MPLPSGWYAEAASWTPDGRQLFAQVVDNSTGGDTVAQRGFVLIDPVRATAASQIVVPPFGGILRPGRGQPGARLGRRGPPAGSAPAVVGASATEPFEVTDLAGNVVEKRTGWLTDIGHCVASRTP